MMALRIINRASALKSVTITRALSSNPSSRFSNPNHHQVETDDDAVSRKIRESLNNDDGRDYGEGDEFGRRRSEGGGDVSGFVAEKAKKGARKTTETAFNAAGAVADGMEQTWGAVKETTEKVKDAVLGDEHERERNYRRNDHAADERLRKGGDDRDSKWRA